MVKLGYVYKIHRWVSLFSVIFLLIFCISGLFLTFREEIFDWNQKVVPTPVAHLSHEKGWEYLPQAVHAVSEKYPNDRVVAAFLQPEEGNILLRIQDKVNPKVTMTMMSMGGEKVAYFPETGEIIDRTYGKNVKYPFVTTALQVMHTWHTRMGLRQGGVPIVALVCSLGLISLISGIILYAPFMRGNKFGKIRSNNRRSKWSDWHKYLGVTAGVWFVILSVSGLMILGFSSTYRTYVDSVQKEAVTKLSAPEFNPEKILPLDVIRAVQKQFPDQYILSINYPEGKRLPAYAVYLTKAVEDPDMNYGQPVFVSADANGKLVQVTEPIPAHVHVLAFGGPDLHIHNHATIVLKVIWAVFSLMAIVLVISGTIIFWKKRTAYVPKPAEVAAVYHEKHAWVWPSVIGLLSVLGLVMPLMGMAGEAIGAGAFIVALIITCVKYFKA